MLSYLKGTIQTKELTGGPHDRLILDVQGVGFEITVSRRTLISLGDSGDEATVPVALSIRENDWTLFGFASGDERQMFGLLQSVTGVGPKLALALIGTLGPEDIASAILSDDFRTVSQAPGVGPKMAQRIVLELKGKVEEWQERRGLSAPAALPAPGKAFEEVRAILEGLGYTPTEINLALKQADEDGLDRDVEVLVRHSLKVLGGAVR